ncbi:methyltransferase domain-containing protein [Enterobacter sp. V87_3]|uniref:methyltransferase domain-containing protein n=1 Tax=Enterobacter sp. V87_3 TaxID=3044236 RepID=UPI00249E3EB1|nr:methyltransferase domain-containing protein [Enterobacter sp. V87_3]MDI3424577.1 methyltransferase domain-containing protein [Enterobacter sp. V87_3]
MTTPTCLICDSEMQFYFQKDKYHAPSMDVLTRDLVPVLFYECPRCHFLSSKTHKEIPFQRWEKLNTDYHHHHSESGGRSVSGFNAPPYIEQALMIELLARHNVVDVSSVLDYAAGYGRLSHLLRKYFNRDIPCYDKYVRNPEHHYIDEPQKKNWSMVINSAMFEHVLTRQDLDDVNDLVSDNGSLLIHTVVVDRIPKDPAWFYTDVPVHTVVHTNKSMNILMEQWGYRSSIYSPKSKCWILLREPYATVKPRIEQINDELQTCWFYGKDGFMDYWKTR